MQLIKTHDGMIGLKTSEKTIWCNSVDEAITIMTAHYAKLDTDPKQIRKDVVYALDYMIRTGDSIAHFGVFGSFMYTTTDPEYEF